MTLINDSLLKQALNRNSEEAYTEEDLLKVVQLLMDLGFDKGDTKAVFQELEEQEVRLYGKKRSKEEILADLKEINQEIADLQSEESEIDLKIAEIEQKIEREKAKRKFEL